MIIYLIGYMGSGKTTIGKNVAEKLNWKFVDMDEIIEKKYEMPVSEIFRFFGENEFRGTEQEVLQELSKSTENCIISTGGGSPCFFDNIEVMKNTGKTVYLNFTAEELSERLYATNLKKRPILANLQRSDLLDFINENLKRRELFYNQAQIEIKGKDEEIEDKLVEICNL